MILYNIRRRGPYEYDKFILNTFQLANEVRQMEKDFRAGSLSRLKQADSELRQAFDALLGEDSLLQEIRDWKEETGAGI